MPVFSGEGLGDPNTCTQGLGVGGTMAFCFFLWFSSFHLGQLACIEDLALLTVWLTDDENLRW